ncbi:6-bladed beta-propeller [Gaoshiqia sp. Z1-71]|uniref:6-bladed beta-propeller n=1 Tax=Gaoshiqia hydrogeniformans TaxID=3290090 RepID=UPI003BF85E2D
MNLHNKTGLYLICIKVLFLFSGCDSKTDVDKNRQEQTLHFDVSNWEEKQAIPRKIIKSIKFTPLETTDSSLIGSIGKMYKLDGFLYVKDNQYVKEILIYNHNGKYERSIGKYGRGAGEFIDLTDFLIDEKQNHLLILDNQQRKVLTYNLVNGDHINDLKIQFWATNFSNPEDHVLSFYSKDQDLAGPKHLIANLDLIENSKEWFLEQDQYDKHFSYRHSIFQSENTYFAPYFKDVVYRITKDKVEPFITFNFCKDKIPKEKLQNKERLREIQEVLDEKNWTYGIENVIENEHFLTFNFKLRNQNVIVIYCKESGNYVYGNHFEGGLGAFPLIKYITVSENEFIGVIDAFLFCRMKQMVMEQGNEELKNQYLETLNTVSEESNPIIVSIQYNTF